MGPGLPEPTRLRDLLALAGERLGISGAVQTGTVWSKWRAIVGDAVADHAEPSSLRAGVLRIRADSPAWATEIGYLGADIASRVNRAVGCELVREVRVWTGPRGAGGRPWVAPAGGAPARKRDRERDGSEDPIRAFERARAAWSRRVTKGALTGPGRRPRKPEN